MVNLSELNSNSLFLAPTGDVSKKDPDYLKNLPTLIYLEDMWTGLENWYKDGIVIDVLKAERYLPKFKYEDDGIYRNRLALTSWDDKFKRTIEQDLAGLLSKMVVSNLPPTLEENINNVDLSGNSLDVVLKTLDVLSLRDGSAFCLIDFPNESPPQNELERRRLRSRQRPYLVPIPRKQIINWKYSNASGNLTIEQVVIKREIKKYLDRFDRQYVTQYLVLEPGTFEIYEKTDAVSTEELILVNRGQTSLDFVPIVGYSLHSSDPFLADFPLKCIADLNLDLYRYDADLKWSQHLANCPTLVYETMSKVKDGTLQGTQQTKQDEELKIGAGQIIFAESKVYWLELEGKTLESTMKLMQLTNENIDRKSIGYLTGILGKQKTATEISINASQAEANLEAISKQKQSAIEQILRVWQSYTNENVEPEFSFDTSFLTKSLQNTTLSDYRESWLVGWLSHSLSLKLASDAGAFPKPLSDRELEDELSNNRVESQLTPPPILPSEPDERGNV
ncbi:MAG: DUF4055 domain-containing protein [Prochloraceae cyanobacterium]|nr:DUF4055 domain-containing protein [Prochloraceae cyanobacterium]